MRLPLCGLLALAVACGGDDGGGPPAPRGYDARSYELRGRLDWGARKLIASEDISVVVVAGASRTIELDSAVAVKRVRAGERDLPFTVDADARLLRVDLGSLSPGGDPVTFTVDYEAAGSSSLIFTTGRDADPVTTRVAFTDSEPDRGSRWLVASHRPDDRARFTVELSVDAGEDVIANGARKLDQPEGGGRRVRYEMDDPIPTYIMAFAAGQLTHADSMAGDVPIAIWHRMGLVVDTAQHLSMIAGMIASFEKLLGPYPWDSYAVVMLPEMPGGMENAGITFNIEPSGQGNIGFGLNAHELGHQWYGDFVTVETFDDIWIKEGMATLLASEADRARRDLENKGRLFGEDFGFDPRDSIRDLSLSGLDRYTSGPYARSAWLLTQMRAKLGDQAFFAGLRKILEDHRLGSIGSDAFLDEMPLDAATRAKARDALDEKRVPAIGITASGSDLVLSLEDPGGTMLVPIELTVVDAAGAAAVKPLAAGTPVTLRIPDGGYLAIDEKDVHPDWTSQTFDLDEDFSTKVAPSMVPPPGAAETAFLSRSAAAQERAYFARGLRDTTPETFAAYYAALDSRVVRRSVELAACRRGRTDAAWAGAVAPIVKNPSSSTFSTGFGRCGVDFATQNFAAELAQLMASTAYAANAPRLQFLAGFDYGAAVSFDAFTRMATTFPSMQLRETAISRLAYQAEEGWGYSAVPAEANPMWAAFFRERLTEARTATRFLMVWRGLRGLADAEALPQVGAKLHEVPMASGDQAQTVCDVADVFGTDGAEWTTFKQAVQPESSLSAAAREVLGDPAKCAQ